ncbi:stomatin family protein [Lentinula edodes]|uniref:stomatin family protein n=1 Tax=Lentinula edodes TaxID=5353 RepID=UPI001E8CABE8|nr:stomatin family protein [Lentinula edodes]KAH7880411.1 stomatin family protein [Lentinula edodes]
MWMHTVAGRRRLATGLGVRRPTGARTIVTVIQQGYEGWRLSFGRNPVRLPPGINLKIPVYHTVQVVDLRESSISIPNARPVPVICSGSLFFRIVDGYRACFSVSDVQANIKNTGTSAMRAVLGWFSYDQVISDRNGLNEQLNSVIGNTIANWGVHCTRFEVQSFQPANREVERQLELQMEAERNRRKQLLDTQAQINIAEGQKQRVILESEGHLEAKSNEADAKYKTVVREAEARQQQSIMEASALAEQVSKLALSISGAVDEAHVQSSDQRRALDALVELRRLEQLKAIAKGSGTSTYFFGDSSILGSNALGRAYFIDYVEKTKATSGDKISAPRTTDSGTHLMPS